MKALVVIAVIPVTLALTSLLGFSQQSAQPKSKSAGSASYLMHYAALRGETKSIEMMLTLGADVNVRDDQNKTPLHDACLKGHADTVHFLLDHGANVGARDKNGATPFHDAALGGAPTIIKILLERKADALARDAEGLTALDYAQKMERGEAVRLLNDFLRK